MKLSSRKLERGTRVELQMTSMIDVVFLLLIFFMTTAAFVQTERSLNSAVSTKSKAPARKPREVEPTIVEVTESSPGKFVYKLGAREFTSQEELAEVVRKKKQIDVRNVLAGAVGPSGPEAFVRVHDGAPFEMAVAAIQVLTSAGYQGVAYVPMSAPP